MHIPRNSIVKVRQYREWKGRRVELWPTAVFQYEDEAGNAVVKWPDGRLETVPPMAIRMS